MELIGIDDDSCFHCRLVGRFVVVVIGLKVYFMFFQRFIVKFFPVNSPRQQKRNVRCKHCNSCAAIQTWIWFIAILT